MNFLTQYLSEVDQFLAASRVKPNPKKPEICRTFPPSCFEYNSDIIEIYSNVQGILYSALPTENPDDKSITDKLNLEVLTAKINKLFDNKTNKFRRKMDKKLAPLSQKVNVLIRTQKETKESIEDKRDQYMQDQVTAKQKVNDDFENDLNTFENQLKSDRNDMESQVKLASENFEQYLAQRLDGLSKQYQNQLDLKDNDNARLQLSLQNQIHEKHAIKSEITKQIEDENKQFALKHEKISSDYSSKREALELKKKDIQEKIDEIQEVLQNGKMSSDDIFKRNEDKLVKKLEAEIDTHKNKINELDSVKKELNTKIQQLQLESQKAKIKFENEINGQKKEIESQLLEEQKKTMEIIKDEEKKIEENYKQKKGQIAIQIEENVKLRSENEKELNSKAHNAYLESEQNIQDYKKKSINEIMLKKNELNEARKLLEKTKNEAKKDINDRKSKVQQNLGNVMQSVDVKTNKVALEIVEIMKAFDDQQRILSEMREKSLQERNFKKTEKINKIKKEHEQRMKGLITKFDEMREKVAEEKFKENKTEITEKHEDNVKELNERILNCRGKMELLQMKVNGFVKINEERMKQIKEQLPQFFSEEEEEDNENNQSAAISAVPSTFDEAISNSGEKPKKPEEVLKIVEKHINVFQEEEKEIKENLISIQVSFQDKMNKLEEQFNQSKNHIKFEGNHADKRASQLKTQLSNQKKKMTKLAQIAASKKTEVEEFSKSYDQQKETFEKETRNVFDKSLQETKNESTNFEEEMKNLRVSFEGSISSLSKQLENAKENTIKITEFRTKEREELMMETEKILKEEHEERMLMIQKKHNQIMKEQDQLIKEKRDFVSSQKVQIVEDCEKSKEENLANFEKQKEHFEQSNLELTEESNLLDIRIQEERERECVNCTKKKELIRNILEKRKVLEERLKIRNKEMIETDKEMNLIFNDNPLPSIGLQPLSTAVNESFDMSNQFSKTPASNSMMKLSVRPISEMGNRSVSITYKRTNSSTKAIPQKTVNAFSKTDSVAPLMKHKFESTTRIEKQHGATLKVPNLNNVRSVSAKLTKRNNLVS